jgi:hypothetical protein
MPTVEEIERGLKDRYWVVREAWAERMDYVPTPEQVERGLTNKGWGGWEVRAAWAERMDYVPTPEQVERGLTDGVSEVRAAWAARMDYVPTPEQVERGLTDEEWGVREAWAERIESIADIFSAEDIAKLCGNQRIASSVRGHVVWIYSNSEEQIERGLTQQLRSKFGTLGRANGLRPYAGGDRTGT